MAVNDKLDKVPPKSGTTGIPPTLVTGRGTQGTKIGTSRQKLDRWQPYLAAALIWWQTLDSSLYPKLICDEPNLTCTETDIKCTEAVCTKKLCTEIMCTESVQYRNRPTPSDHPREYRLPYCRIHWLRLGLALGGDPCLYAMNLCAETKLWCTDT